MRNCIYLLLIVFTFFNCHPNHHQKEAENLIQQVKSEFVQDGRTKLFKLTANEHNGKIAIKGETNLPDAKKRLLNLLEQTKIPFLDSLAILPSAALQGKITESFVCRFATFGRSQNMLVSWRPKH